MLSNKDGIVLIPEDKADTFIIIEGSIENFTRQFNRMDEEMPSCKHFILKPCGMHDYRM